MLYIENAAAHTRGRMRTATCNVRASYSYATSLLAELKSMQSIECKINRLSLKDFLPTKISQTKTSSLSVNMTYLKAMSSFFYNPAEKKRVFAACAKTCSQRAARADRRPFRPGERVVSLARAAERSPRPSTLRYFGRVRKSTSTPHSLYDIIVTRKSFDTRNTTQQLS